ncbi:Lipoprotein [Bacillus mycoides]|nr:Lipoprotein [Bacillus mycoides]
MKMKKVAIASVAIGTMLTMAACSTFTDKDEAKKDQATTQNEEQSKTTSADEASKTTKDTEKDTNTSSNEKTDKDAKNTKESSGTESNGKTTKEKETTGKTNDQTTSGKTTDQSTSTNNNGKTTKDPKKNVAVKANVKEVVALIESLDKQLAANPKLETVNKLGKQINEKWDVIEKDIEASHPTEYKTIEQSLYPLIIRAEKEKIDVNKMKSLTTKTKKDLNQLLTKLS